LFQGPTKLTLVHGSRQVSPAKSAADPPELQTAKGNGEQHQLEISPIQSSRIHHCFSSASQFTFSTMTTLPSAKQVPAQTVGHFSCGRTPWSSTWENSSWPKH
jgi:hypothetical protein